MHTSAMNTPKQRKNTQPRARGSNLRVASCEILHHRASSEHRAEKQKVLISRGDRGMPRVHVTCPCPCPCAMSAHAASTERMASPSEKIPKTTKNHSNQRGRHLDGRPTQKRSVARMLCSARTRSRAPRLDAGASGSEPLCATLVRVRAGRNRPCYPEGTHNTRQ